jgi:hypothetical protein
MVEKKKANYVFPNILASAMSKVDMRTQLEASMLSMVFILAGMMVTIFYMAVYIAFPLWYKIVIIINLLAGLVFISSFIVTTFQQYQSYLDAVGFQEELKGIKEDKDRVKEDIKNLKGGTQEENAKEN